MKNLAIIPARRGSKGILRKNTALLARKPLIFYTLKAAKAARIFDRLVVSTDDAKVKKIAQKMKIEVLDRPRHLRGDRVTTEAVMQQVLRQLKANDQYMPDTVCLLQPTSPLRNAAHIKQAFRKFKSVGSDSLLSVYRNTHFIWKKAASSLRAMNYDYKHRPRRQDLKHQYIENGAIYFTKYKTFLKKRNRLGGKIGYYLMSQAQSIEIDSVIDLKLCEKVMHAKKL